jgi:hypothetical protein
MRDFRSKIALLALSGLAGCSDDSSGPQLVIELTPVEGECTVRAARMNCEEVPAYLRDALKLPSNTFIAVSSGKTERVNALAPIMGALNAAGYTSVIGDIPISGQRNP